MAKLILWDVIGEHDRRSTMKQSIIIAILICSMLFCYPTLAEQFSNEELQTAVIQEFPDWKIWRIDKYGSGVWQGEIELNCKIGLLRLAEGNLSLKSLYTLLSPLKKGDRIPWEETEWLSVPLSREAFELLSSMPLDGIDSYGAGFVFPDTLMQGIAEFMIDEGMIWDTLIASPGFLVGIAQDAEELQSLRVAYWDGETYSKISSSTPQHTQLSINEAHSYSDAIELFIDDVETYLRCYEDGVWKIKIINNGMEIFDIHKNAVEDITFGSGGQSNNNFHYGYPEFSITLEDVDFARMPKSIEEAISLLNADGLACTKAEKSKMYDAPNGRLMALCYARAVGQVIDVKGKWVRLRFGSVEEGLEGWFLENELSFGKDIEEVVCGFPSYAFGENESEHLERVIPGITISLDESFNDVWLIGHSPDGKWLVSVNEQQVLFADEDAFSNIGPTEYDE